jgi:hypothetical protein
MALQSSGQIKISEIKAELGSSSNSLRALSAAANLSVPDAMSEFYGFSAAKYYWDLSNDIKWDSATDKPLQTAEESLSVSLWIRPQWAATDLNLIIFDLTPSGTTSTANRFFLQYDYGLNRFIARYRSASANFDRQLALHSNNSATGTGTSSSNRWTGSNRGNVNSDGFVHLFLTYNAPEQNPTNAFKIYWNNVELTSTAATSTGAKDTMSLNELTFCGNDHNTSGSRIADYMYMHMWDDVRSAGDIDSMYNSGDPISASDAGVTTNLIFGDTSESVPSVNAADDSGNYDFASANSQSIVQL